jgi:dolichol kinase
LPAKRKSKERILMQDYSLETESKRKLIHLLGGICIVSLIFYDWLNAYSLAIITLAFFAIILLIKYGKLPFLDKFIESLERPELRRSFPGKGVLFYLIGSSLSLLLFPKDIAMSSIIILAIADSIPTLVSIYSGRTKKHSTEKFVKGAIIGLILSFLASSLIIKWYEALIASAVAVSVEGIDMKIGLEKIDDNFIIPLSAGITISILRFFGI